MRARLTWSAVTLALVAAAAAGSAWTAEPNGRAAAPALKLSTARALPGARVLLSGRRFHLRRRSAIFLGGRRLRTFKTSGRGSFRLYVRVPQRAAGVYTLAAKSGRRVARRRFRVLARALPAAPSPPLAAPTGEAPPPPDPTRLVAAGDIACHPSEDIDERPPPGSCHHAAVSDRVLALAPDYVAPLGDLQYERGFPDDYLGSYAPTWGRFKQITRPAPGNHEYAASDDRLTAPGYYGYFGNLAGDPGKGYYTYELGDWQAIVLNSGDIAWAINSTTIEDDCFPVPCKAGSEQEQWLRQTLESLPAEKCVVAYWHHPRWSSTNPFDYDEVAPLYQALYDHGVELALVGHSHAYERFAEMHPGGTADPGRGVRQFVVGTGGKDRRFADPTPATTRAGSEKQLLNAAGFGVLELSLYANRYEFRFVHEGGGVLDEGGGACHGAG